MLFLGCLAVAAIYFAATVKKLERLSSNKSNKRNASKRINRRSIRACRTTVHCAGYNCSWQWSCDLVPPTFITFFKQTHAPALYAGAHCERWRRVACFQSILQRAKYVYWPRAWFARAWRGMRVRMQSHRWRTRTHAHTSQYALMSQFEMLKMFGMRNK